MKIQISRPILFLISILFTVGLIFASLELPNLLDRGLQNALNIPGFDQQASDLNHIKTEMWMTHYHVKIIGYIGLISIILLIILGLKFEKKNLTLLGTIGFFLPIFGHFAITMFFLAGLGFMRILWIPLNDISPVIMRLGDIIYIPNDMLIWLCRLIFPHPQKGIAIFFIIIGVFLFVAGVYTWFLTKANKQNVVNSFIYKISRHPQYLGWILWSYGLFLMPVDHLKKSWGYADSLPLLLTFMIIIAISLMEELKVTKDFGKEYMKFKSKTAFMFPLPKKFLSWLMLPLRVFSKKDSIDKKSDIMVLVSYHTIVLIFLSYIYVSYNDPNVKNPLFTGVHERQIEKYANILMHDDYYRAKNNATYELIKFGDAATGPLLEAITYTHELTRNNAIFALSQIGNEVACNAIYQAYKDTTVKAQESAFGALVGLNCPRIKEEIPELLVNGKGRFKVMAVGAAAKFQMKEMTGLILQNIDNVHKYDLVTYIEALRELGDQSVIDKISSYLNHEYDRVQESAIFALMKIGSQKSIDALEPLTKSDNWEIVIYAKEAIKRIKKSQNLSL